MRIQGYKKRQWTVPEEVRQIRKRIEHWRKTRKRRTAMPADIWRQAAEAARVHGIYRMAQALRLSYDSLKGRVLAASKHDGSGGKGYPGFVDLGPAQLMGLAQPAGPVVELLDADGSRLAIRLTQGSELDARALAEAFWGRRK